MSSEARPPIFRMAREDVWEFPRPNMDLVPELIKYSAATVAVVAAVRLEYVGHSALM